jgi:hypothetical protein
MTPGLGGRYRHPMITHALLAAAMPARGPLFAIRLRAGRPALAVAG